MAPIHDQRKSQLTSFQGRAGLVALRRSRGEAVGALGKAFYKGGFEPKMNKREASLILQLRYVHTPFRTAVRNKAKRQEGVERRQGGAGMGMEIWLKIMGIQLMSA